MATSLTPMQLERLQAVFSVFAAPSPPPFEGILGIGPKELSSVLHALRVSSTEAEVTALISRCDTQGRAFLDFAEFAQLLAGELKDVDSDAELVEAFAALDRDGDGVVGVQDVATLLAGAGKAAAANGGAGTAAADAPLTRSDIEGIVADAAGPGAKGMSLEQFVAVMQTQQ
jgi:Ca2+-binding EF-hand superfamily protein